MASLAIGSVRVCVDCRSASLVVAFDPDVIPFDGLTRAARSNECKGGVGVVFEEFNEGIVVMANPSR
jgi:hypothetical protein